MLYSPVVVSFLLLVVRIASVFAQHTEATCGQQFSWMFNHQNPPQSPCLVTAFLGKVCSTNNDFDVQSLTAGAAGPDTTHYSIGANPTACECTSVMYNLFSACAACQVQSVTPWANYNMNCSSVGQALTDGDFPPGIPNGTAVPEWAFQKVFSSNQFNVSQAQLDAASNQPDVTASVASATTPSSTSASSTSRPASSHSTNVGAIAGGVVGGVVGLGLIIAAGLFFLNKRKKSTTAPTIDSSAMSMRTYDTYQNPPMTGKLYNPDDPTTFPPTGHSVKPSTDSTTVSGTSEDPLRWTPFDPRDTIAEV